MSVLYSKNLYRKSRNYGLTLITITTQKNKEYNNQDIDPQVMENIVLLCGEVSMDLPVNEKL